METSVLISDLNQDLAEGTERSSRNGRGFELEGGRYHLDRDADRDLERELEEYLRRLERLERDADRDLEREMDEYPATGRNLERDVVPLLGREVTSNSSLAVMDLINAFTISFSSSFSISLFCSALSISRIDQLDSLFVQDRAAIMPREYVF